MDSRKQLGLIDYQGVKRVRELKSYIYSGLETWTFSPRSTYLFQYAKLSIGVWQSSATFI